MTQLIGRVCDLDKLKETQDLEVGMDFRKVEYRREVFLRFYEFHLKYNAHPGGVYLAFPWLAKNFNMTTEQKLWLAFINGCSQNIVTSWFIYNQFPVLQDVDITKLNDWWNANYQKFKAGSGWDSDRKYFKIGKNGFPQCVEKYQKIVKEHGNSQESLFLSLTEGKTQFEAFNSTWEFVRANFLTFGRLSAFSYLEYLRLQNVPIECDNLFLEDVSGSKSHRNGLCKVLGRDDLDWHDGSNPNFPGYEPHVIDWLKREGKLLLDEAFKRDLGKDVSYFTLESTFCCYKSWHRPNRRYPNVYMDMFHNRIKYAESEWGKNFDIFWEMRKDGLPKQLRLEDNPNDPGLSKPKQNHYRETGQVILMDLDWDCFENNFNKQQNYEGFFHV